MTPTTKIHDRNGTVTYVAMHPNNVVRRIRQAQRDSTAVTVLEDGRRLRVDRVTAVERDGHWIDRPSRGSSVIADPILLTTGHARQTGTAGDPPTGDEGAQRDGRSSGRPAAARSVGLPAANTPGGGGRRHYQRAEPLNPS